MQVDIDRIGRGLGVIEVERELAASELPPPATGELESSELHAAPEIANDVTRTSIEQCVFVRLPSEPTGLSAF